VDDIGRDHARSEPAGGERVTELIVTTHMTPLGVIPMAGIERGLVRMGLPGDDPDRFVRALEEDLGVIATEGSLDFLPIRKELEEYFDGKKVEFATPVQLLEGTPFQQSVWEELRRIPYGTVRSYGEVARRLGRPGGGRAVGQANNRNPVPIVIPCHRVVAADGGLGGFGGREELKVRLLGLEGVGFDGGKILVSAIAGRTTRRKREYGRERARTRRGRQDPGGRSLPGGPSGGRRVRHGRRGPGRVL
jgi:methylated-DNA-[protein]-cysteine S-methyltransferase